MRQGGGRGRQARGDVERGGPGPEVAAGSSGTDSRSHGGRRVGGERVRGRHEVHGRTRHGGGKGMDAQGWAETGAWRWRGSAVGRGGGSGRRMKKG